MEIVLGIKAFVMCNCFTEGKASPPPVSLTFNKSEGSFFTAESFSGLDKSIREWIKTACPHKNMELVSGRISWDAYRVFRQALEDCGWDLFPTLSYELPTEESRSTTPENAKLMLDELSKFQAIKSFGSRTQLTDTDTGYVIAESIPKNDGFFSGGDIYDMGVDPDGFWIQHRVEKTEVFRSFKFQQGEPLSPTNEASFKDGHSGLIFDCPFSLWGEDRFVDGKIRADRPRHLEVKKKPFKPSEFKKTVKLLENLCETSIELQSPIFWR